MLQPHPLTPDTRRELLSEYHPAAGIVEVRGFHVDGVIFALVTVDTPYQEFPRTDIMAPERQRGGAPAGRWRAADLADLVERADRSRARTAAERAVLDVFPEAQR